MAKQSTTNISIRMDTALKADADAFFNDLGMNLSTAFNIFVRQCLRDGCIPFKISLGDSNKENIQAALEARNIAYDTNNVIFDDVEKALEELKK